MAFDALPDHPALPLAERGAGDPLVLFHGFGLTANTYKDTVRVLARTHRVLMPDWLHVHHHWSYEKALAGTLAILDDHEVERAVLVGHSFGGSLALGLAARFPERVTHLVISDSLGLAPRWTLARQAIPSLDLLRLATPRAAADWLITAARWPVSLARAGLWGFLARKDDEIDAVARAQVPVTVMWAQRDTLLDSDEGRDFAARLGGAFVSVDHDIEGPIDHDWMYRHPGLFSRMLVDVLGEPGPGLDGGTHVDRTPANGGAG